MRKANEMIKYTCKGYRHAPESFKAYKVILDQSGRGNHIYLPLKLSQEQEHEIGMACVCEGENAAAALAKRFDREMMKRPRQYVTYGFLDARNPSIFHYSEQFRFRHNTPLQERFRIYLELKEHLQDGIQYVVNKCTLDANFKPANVKKESAIQHVNADLTKPVVVYLNVA